MRIATRSRVKRRLSALDTKYTIFQDRKESSQFTDVFLSTKRKLPLQSCKIVYSATSAESRWFRTNVKFTVQAKGLKCACATTLKSDSLQCFCAAAPESYFASLIWNWSFSSRSTCTESGTFRARFIKNNFYLKKNVWSVKKYIKGVKEIL